MTYDFNADRQKTFASVKAMILMGTAMFNKEPTVAQVLFGFAEALREFTGTDAISKATAKALTIRAADIASVVADSEALATAMGKADTALNTSYDASLDATHG